MTRRFTLQLVPRPDDVVPVIQQPLPETWLAVMQCAQCRGALQIVAITDSSRVIRTGQNPLPESDSDTTEVEAYCGDCTMSHLFRGAPDDVEPQCLNSRGTHFNCVDRHHCIHRDYYHHCPSHDNSRNPHQE